MNGFSFIKVLLPILGAVTFFSFSSAEKLVILHTNDTHSTIDLLPDGTGGILQRKAIFDSVRNVEKNVITVDAGDVVQGTLYFKYFKGDVEYPLLNMTGYDYRILGNHEFDNGMEPLASYYRQLNSIPLSANYDFSGTVLDGVFKEYDIKVIDGKKIGFFGINIEPVGIISNKNIEVAFKDPLITANEMASYLKNKENCDLVIAVTHIGYSKINDKATDVDIAESSEDIDIIIGGHTHTLIDPDNPDEYPSLIPNKNGDNVRIVQVGKQGIYIGKLSIDLEDLPNIKGENIVYELIPVTNRFPADSLDKNMMAYLAPFKESVDKANNIVIAKSRYELPKERLGGLANLTADIGYAIGKEFVDSLRNIGIDIPEIDMSLMNVGGIRHHMAQGNITEGQILATYPFSNRIVIIGLKGSDFVDAMKVSALKGGEAVSSNVRVVTDNSGNLIRVVINDKEIDPEKEYVLVTIDYVAQGNDDLVSIANHRKIWEADEEVSASILRWIRNQNSLGLEIAPDCTPRFVIDVSEQDVFTGKSVEKP